MKTHFLLLLPLLVSFPVSGGASNHTVDHEPPLLGGWQPIEHVKDPHVQEIAKFAITEHNEEAKTNLKFKRVIRGEEQVVAGMNYRLIVAAKDGKVTNNYEVVVWEKTWESFRKLTSFKPV
uniref:Cystatin domain-containing protein n=1 Tax=Nelumbo nucifera TaxID=4432 RepID=A0A822Z019_NELNU|nr:TPA_asm: hypothetical protein HUJ06_008474 [Nelumbo nucifera]